MVVPPLPTLVSTRVDMGQDEERLTPEDARQLTEAIRMTASALHVLVHRAYVGRAHLALGYRRWADYIATEFDMSRARSYQLLDQHAVIATLSEVVGVDVSEVVTEKVARDVKPYLDSVVTELEDRTEMHPDRDQVLSAVIAVLAATRQTHVGSRELTGMGQLRASQSRGSATDLWYTPRTAVAPLLRVLPAPPLRVWAHADVRGRSHIVDVLEEAGYDVVCSDLSTGQDFFSYTRADVAAMGVQLAATNPPFSARREWLAHLVDLGLRFALLVPETGLGDWSFTSLREVGPEAGLLLLDRRIAYSPRWGDQPGGNPPFSSGWICRGLFPPGQQLAFGVVPTTH